MPLAALEQPLGLLDPPLTHAQIGQAQQGEDQVAAVPALELLDRAAARPWSPAGSAVR
jgi:hypothetical protein